MPCGSIIFEYICDKIILLISDFQMNIKRMMSNFLSMLMERRQSGTTTLIKKIAQENDVYVIVHNQQMIQEFDKSIRHKIVPLENIRILEMAEKKPILVDNAVLHLILREGLLEIGTKEEIIRHKDHVLDTVKEVLTLGNKMNPHNGSRMRIQPPFDTSKL